MKKRVAKFRSWCWQKISAHIFTTSIIVGAILCFFVMTTPLKRMEIIPHVITYASCNLALIGFIFSILFGVKGAEMYNRIERLFPCQLEEFYRLVFRTTVTSSLSVFLAILIIAVPKWPELLKIAIAYVSIVVFLYMIIGTYFTLDFLITLMIKDIKKAEKKSII